jgi:hypothetical protein
MKGGGKQSSAQRTTQRYIPEVQWIPVNWDTSGLKYFAPNKRLPQLIGIHCTLHLVVCLIVTSYAVRIHIEETNFASSHYVCPSPSPEIRDALCLVEGRSTSDVVCLVAFITPI